jgi:hypothetical protein
LPEISFGLRARKEHWSKLAEYHSQEAEFDADDQNANIMHMAARG